MIRAFTFASTMAEPTPWRTRHNKSCQIENDTADMSIPRANIPMPQAKTRRLPATSPSHPRVISSPTAATQ